MNKKDKADVKRNNYLLKLSDKELETLAAMSAEKGVSMAEILREGLRMMHNLHLYG